MANDKQRRTVIAAVALVVATVGLASVNWKNDGANVSEYLPGQGAPCLPGRSRPAPGSPCACNPGSHPLDPLNPESPCVGECPPSRHWSLKYNRCVCNIGLVPSSGPGSECVAPTTGKKSALKKDFLPKKSSSKASLDSAVSDLGSKLESAGSALGSGVSSIASGIESGVSSLASGASSFASDVGSGVSSVFSSDSSSDSSDSSVSSESSVSSGSSDSSSDSLSQIVSSLEDELSISSESISSESSSDADRIDQLADEVEDLDEALALAEERLDDLEDDQEKLKKVSGFFIEQYKPANGYRMPSQVIEFRGRTCYDLAFNIKQFGLVGPWGNIINVGDTSGSFRSPGIWTYPNSRRLHIRQRGEMDDGNHAHSHVWNRGCDPSTAVTPPVGTLYAVNVVADHESFRVYYNSVLQCTYNMDVLPPPGQQSVWIGRPGQAANVEITEMKFEIH